MTSTRAGLRVETRFADPGVRALLRDVAARWLARGGSAEALRRVLRESGLEPEPGDSSVGLTDAAVIGPTDSPTRAETEDRTLPSLAAGAVASPALASRAESLPTLGDVPPARATPCLKATTCDDVARRLRELRSADDTISDAVAKILDKADETARGMDAAKQRYEAMANAMVVYSPVLLLAQSDSAAGLAAAIDARKVIEDAWAAREAQRPDLQSADEATRNAAQQKMQQEYGKVIDGQDAFTAARARIEAAVASRDHAADKAASQISMDLQGNALNESWWDRLGDFFASIGTWVWENIDTICLVLDLAAMVLAATGVGGPVAAVLFAVSKVAKAISTIKTVVSLYSAASSGNWAEAAGIVGMFAFGKAAGKVVKWLKIPGLGEEAAKSVKGNQPTWLSGPLKAYNSSLGANISRLSASDGVKQWLGTHLGLTPLPAMAKEVAESWTADYMTYRVNKALIDDPKEAAATADEEASTAAVARVLGRAA